VVEQEDRSLNAGACGTQTGQPMGRYAEEEEMTNRALQTFVAFLVRSLPTLALRMRRTSWF
jgi:hypothetical protein